MGKSSINQADGGVGEVDRVMDWLDIGHMEHRVYAHIRRMEAGGRLRWDDLENGIGSNEP